MRWEAWAWWVVLFCAVAMEVFCGTPKEPVYDALGSLVLVYTAIFGKKNNLVIAWYVMFLAIGKTLDAIQYPYIKLDNNVAEILNIIISTIGAGLLWIKRNKTHGTIK